MLHKTQQILFLNCVLVCFSLSCLAAEKAKTPPVTGTKPGLEQAVETPAASQAPASVKKVKKPAPKRLEAAEESDAAKKLKPSKRLEEPEPHKKPVQPEEQNMWLIGAGVQWRSLKTRSWTGSSYSQDYPIQAQASRGSRQLSDQQYKDGYMRIDKWSAADNQTWYWGYDNASQVQDNLLRLTSYGKRVTDFNRTITVNEGFSKDNGENEFGLYLLAQRVVFQQPSWDLRLHLGVSGIASSFGDKVSNFKDEQNWTIRDEFAVDYYDLDTAKRLPDTPYQGTYEGPGPCVQLTPARTSKDSRLVERGSFLAYNSIKHDLDVRLLTLSLGVSANYQISCFNLGGAIGPTVNIAESDAVYRETLFSAANNGEAGILNQWYDSNKDTDVLFGYFVQAGVGLKLTNWLELNVFGRYDWLQNINCDVGPSRYTVNPEGGSLGGTVNFLF